MTVFFFARHGETVWHDGNRYAGISDVALNDAGRAQADALGQWAAGAALDIIVSSDLSRAVLTAAPAVTATGLSHVVDPDLREVDFGAGDGLTRSEMALRFPEDLDAWLTRPATLSLPGGEAGRTAVTRAMPAIDRLIEQFPEGRVLVVAHSALMRLLLCELLGIDLDDYRRRFPTVVNAAVTSLEVIPGSRGGRDAALLSFNIPTL